MERLILACGGAALNSFGGLTRWGHAGPVYEYPLGEEKFTFTEKCDQVSTQSLKDAIRDILRAVEMLLMAVSLQALMQCKWQWQKP